MQTSIALRAALLTAMAFAGCQPAVATSNQAGDPGTSAALSDGEYYCASPGNLSTDGMCHACDEPDCKGIDPGGNDPQSDCAGLGGTAMFTETPDCGCTVRCVMPSDPPVNCDDTWSCKNGQRLVCDCSGCTQTTDSCAPNDPPADEGLCKEPLNVVCGIVLDSCGHQSDLGPCPSGPCVNGTCPSCDVDVCNSECALGGRGYGVCVGDTCQCAGQGSSECGDAVCNVGEDCSSCSEDCGACSGGGDRGPIEEQCVSYWYDYGFYSYEECVAVLSDS